MVGVFCCPTALTFARLTLLTPSPRLPRLFGTQSPASRAIYAGRAKKNDQLAEVNSAAESAAFAPIDAVNNW
jgi:hypothetical protein